MKPSRTVPSVPSDCGSKPWSAHALAPAIGFHGPLNSLAPLKSIPRAVQACRAMVGEPRAESFKAWMTIWKHLLGDNYLGAPR